MRIELQDNYTIMCQVNNSARIRWTFDGGALPSNTFQTGQHGLSSSLTITFASKANSGQYVCLASSPSGSYNGVDLVHVEVYGMLVNYLPVISSYLTFQISLKSPTFHGS